MSKAQQQRSKRSKEKLKNIRDLWKIDFADAIKRKLE